MTHSGRVSSSWPPILCCSTALTRYGPETKDAREALRRLVVATIDRLWPENASIASGLEASTITANGGKLIDQIRDLTPKNEGQRWAQSQALQLTTDLARSRWLLIEQNASAIPTAFLVVVVFWLTVLFASFGLFSPWNSTIVATLVCALSVASAMFLIVDLDQPFGGLIQISSTPLATRFHRLVNNEDRRFVVSLPMKTLQIASATD